MNSGSSARTSYWLAPLSVRAAWWGSLLVAAGALAILVATAHMLPMVWDEGNTIRRARTLPTLVQSGSTDWPYTTQIEGHPALYGMVLAAGHAVTQAWLPPLMAWRAASHVLLAIACGAMFFRMGRDFSLLAGILAPAALLLQPRLFSHAHTALYDGQLTAWWILTWVAFVAAQHRPRWIVLFGVLLGCTMATKFTGWLAPLAFIAWCLLRPRDRRAWTVLGAGVVLAVAIFFVLNPPLWSEPIRGMQQFLTLNLTRAKFNITGCFFGRLYNLDYSLPWYNTIVWTAITIPIGLFAFFLVGLGGSLRSGDARPLRLLIVANWLVLIVVRALPGTPPHDGIRLILPAFGFVAPLTALGAHDLVTWASSRAGRSVPRLAWTCVMLAWLGAASSVWWYAPQWLSYYNLLIGGLPGAVRAGMEPTYYWDGCDDQVLDWLAENTPEGKYVRFGPSSSENWMLLDEWDRLGFRWATRWTRQCERAAGSCHWYVLQRRPSAMKRDEWELVLGPVDPVFVKRIAPQGWGPWRLDTPLVEVYPFEAYLEAKSRADRKADEATEDQ